MTTRTTVTGAFNVLQERKKRTRSCGTNTWSAYVVTASTYTGSVRTKSITSVNTPDFQSLLKCGRFLPLNPVDISDETETRSCLGDFYHATSSLACMSNGKVLAEDIGPKFDVNDFSLFDGYPDDAVRQAVVNQAAANAASAAFDALTFLAEFHQLQKLFVSNLGRVTNFGVRAANFARRFKRSRDREKAFGEKWLEYRYGWLPAIYSLRDFQKALEGSVKAGWVEGKGQQTVNFSDSHVSSGASGTFATVTQTETVNAVHIARGWAAAEVGDPFTANFGFDPILTAWELVPYSFVADWFVQVGTWINAASPFSAGTLLGVQSSVRSSVTRSVISEVEYHTDASGNKHTGGGQVARRELTLERYLRFPSEVGLPGWNPRITPERIIDAIALAIGSKLRVLRILRT